MINSGKAGVLGRACGIFLVAGSSVVMLYVVQDGTGLNTPLDAQHGTKPEGMDLLAWMR